MCACVFRGIYENYMLCFGAVRLYSVSRVYQCCVIVPSLLFGSDRFESPPFFSEYL